MNGISSKSLNFGQPENKKKYQQYEFNSDFDINLYESFYRTHDPQLGRFWQIDPKPADFESLYAAMGNNPIKNFDLLGDTVYSRDARHDKDIQDRVAQGLNLKKGQVNPIEIDKGTGLLSLNKKAYIKLSKEQKSVLKPLIGLMKDKAEFGLNVVGKDYVPHKFDGGVKAVDVNGKVHDGPSTDLYGGGFSVTRYSEEFGKVTTEIYTEAIDNKRTTKSITGGTTEMPNYVIQFHEFAHPYYRNVLKDERNQGCKAIDAENEVRRLNGLPLRAYDSAGVHKDPDK